jgi:adenylosuccinate lyase
LRIVVSKKSPVQEEKEHLSKYDLFSPTDFRYSVPELQPFLSEEAYVAYKAKVEGALAFQLAKAGICSLAVAKEIEEASRKIAASEVYEEERRIKHDIRALVNVIRNKVSDKAKPFVHLAATSYDIVDSANALRFKDVLEKVVIPDLLQLEKALIEILRLYSDRVQVGRTHGQHAEPVTFGYYISFYVSRLGKRIVAIKNATANLTGKFAGAVGVYGPLSLLVDNPQKFEEELLSSLGLKVSEVSTQIVQPEPMTDLIHYIVSTFSILANFSRDMRNLQRTEIAEVNEQFSSKEQVGSSTMPQKRNPINFENVESLWKKFMPQMITMYLDQISDHQRDLTNSSSQRYLPELVVAFDYAVRRLLRTIWDVTKGKPRLVVDSQNMKRNFEMSKEEVAAEPLYILLAASGHPDAHEMVRAIVQNSITEKKSFREELDKNPELRRYFESIPEKKRKYVEDPNLYTGIATNKALEIARIWEEELGLN